MRPVGGLTNEDTSKSLRVKQILAILLRHSLPTCLFLVVFLNKSLRGGVAPGCLEGLPNRQLIGVAKADDRAPATAPCPGGGAEHGRLATDVRRLQRRRQ